MHMQVLARAYHDTRARVLVRLRVRVEIKRNVRVHGSQVTRVRAIVSLARAREKLMQAAHY